MIERFTAGTQYGDYKGSSSADRNDIDIKDWLDNNERLQEDEYILGISMSNGSNNGKHRDPVSVQFLVSKTSIGSINNKPILVREIDKNMKLSEFFSLFKRFNITLSIDGKFEGKEYTSK